MLVEPAEEGEIGFIDYANEIDGSGAAATGAAGLSVVGVLVVLIGTPLLTASRR